MFKQDEWAEFADDEYGTIHDHCLVCGAEKEPYEGVEVISRTHEAETEGVPFTRLAVVCPDCETDVRAALREIGE